MDLVTASRNLSASADALARRIYASLPWGYRVAQFLMVLADDGIQEFGRMAYGLFLMNGVQGLPDVELKDHTMVPAESLMPKDHNDIRKKFPLGWGADFGRQCYGTLLRVVKNRETTRDLMQRGLEKLSVGDLGRSLPNDLPGARRFFLKAMVNEGIDWWHKKKLEQKSLTNDEGIERIIADPSNPEFYQEFGREVAPEKIEAIKRDVAKHNPELAQDIPLYIDLLMDGTSRRQIVMQKMIPYLQNHPMAPQGFQRWHQLIEKAVEKHLT